ncbi:FitA-like ribbon-helix-helix domain-containing protein [Microlunatus parietis]|uniref:Antitoxin FitA-like ribbon-helix-helix domain-containing protein n=1 Tax=Microlunatus parietis TaxID=682979 RepID=A0A7Y9L9Z7_9ACTN|nr:hypothetical protein [Microlunatus parietis]NYE69120.1 hypothetical protein [Microlunatus parietis]
MVALQIRDVPEEVRDALAERAAQNGQSLQGFLLGVVLREASFAQNRNLLREVAEWTVGTGVTGDDVLAIIDEGRAGRPGGAG